MHEVETFACDCHPNEGGMVPMPGGEWIRVRQLAEALSLPTYSPADAVLARVRDGERARRAWEWLERRPWLSVCVSTDDPLTWGVLDNGTDATPDGWVVDMHPTPLAAVLAAMDAQGDKP